MGSIPRANTPPPVIDKTLSVEGAVAESKAVGDKITNIVTKKTIGKWTCLLIGNIKIAYYNGRYGNLDINKSEGSLFWNSFSFDMPSNFFSSYPCVQTQCELESGYAIQLVLNPNSSKDKLNGWFYTNLSRTSVNPYIHLLCIGV